MENGYSAGLGSIYGPLANRISNGCQRQRSIDWQKFRDWLVMRGFSRAYIKDQLCYGKRYWRYLFNGKFAELGAEKGCRHALMALSAVSRFLGCYDWFLYLKRNSGLKWNKKNADVFSLIYGGQEIEGLENWLGECRANLEDSAWFTVKWLAISGLRTSEGFNSLEIIRTKGLRGYVNSELGIIEHFRYPKTFMRRTKKTFLTIVDDEIIEQLKKWKKRFTYIMLQKRLRKLNLKCRTYDLRKNWASFMVMKGVPESVVDLCQGRIGGTVFQQSYFRPSMADVVEQVRNALGKYIIEMGL
jgi:hypothetical protein